LAGLIDLFALCRFVVLLDVYSSHYTAGIGYIMYDTRCLMLIYTGMFLYLLTDCGRGDGCSDIQMPVMDGFEATKRLRLHEMESGVGDAMRQLIIGISANSGDSIEKTAYSSGMNTFMPVSDTTFLLTCLAV
jgi:hypothetical protein